MSDLVDKDIMPSQTEHSCQLDPLDAARLDAAIDKAAINEATTGPIPVKLGSKVVNAYVSPLLDETGQLEKLEVGL